MTTILGNAYPSLTDQEVLARRKQFGLNELPTDEKKNSFYFILKLLKEPMLLLMVTAAVLYLILGDWEEGLLLGVSVFFVMGLSYYQEQKSSNALEKLKELSSPRALVIRNGIEQRIPANEIVPDDLVILSEGDRVPADGFLLESVNLTVDESLLTGESFSIEKDALAADKISKSQSDTDFKAIANKNKVFCSTLVVAGRGLLRVRRIGLLTEVGKIGVSLREPVTESLNLNFEIRQLVKIFAWTGAIVSVALILIYGISQGSWIQAILLGLATQMSLLPEEFPVILSVFMALGAWRLSKVKMLIRNPTAIERLGAVTVLCVDKTGTLTQNKMTVGKFFDGNSFIQPDPIDSAPRKYRDILFYSALASPKNPFDPMEIALGKMAEKDIDEYQDYLRNGNILKEIGLSDSIKATTFFWENLSDANSVLVCMKGAPEAIMNHCQLSVGEIATVKAAIEKMAADGFRVLAVASNKIPKSNLNLNLLDQNLKLSGLIGFEDPLRAEVPEAVRICRQAGVRVIMMTGDHAQTALKIAQLAGLNTQGQVITGQQIEKLSDAEFLKQLAAVNVFARMIPEQKLRLVKLLKQQSQVVAMTGDGVNDAPSLKWADIGIAMGLRGTDVAREASDIVLMDDNFASIVSGIKRGRIIFNNIRKAIGYVVSIHVPIAGLAILPIFFGWPIILMPAHIVLIEIIIDPVCSLLFESLESEEDLMKNPPRKLSTRLFTLKDYIRGFLQGGFVLGILTAALWYLNSQQMPSSQIRGIIFFLLIVFNVSLILADVGSGSLNQIKILFNRWTHIMAAAAFSFGIALIFNLKLTQKLFQISRFSLVEFSYILILCSLVFLSLNFWNRISFSKDQ